jgi:hypothetical protein
MKTLHFMAIFLPALCIATGQTSTLSPRNYTVDLENRFPSVGALLIVAEPGNALGVPAGIGAMSTGTLIHERVFLTSGHGVGPSLPALPPGIKTYVSFSPNARDSSAWMLGGKQVLHPSMPPCGLPQGGCDPTTTNAFKAGDPLVSDLGLIFLTQPVRGIRPAKIGSPDTLNRKVIGSRMRTVGYGHPVAGPGGTRPPVPERLGLRKYRSSNLERVLNDRWATWELPSAVCYGDSGSPTFSDHAPNTWRNHQTVVAVASDGGADCLSKDFRVRVDTHDIREWIRSTIRDQLGERAVQELDWR